MYVCMQCSDRVATVLEIREKSGKVKMGQISQGKVREFKQVVQTLSFNIS